MTTRLLVLALVLLAGCDSATGTVSGGEALVAEPEAGSGTTWTALYGDFFGPGGRTSCTANTSCHGTADESGAQISGFVCGATKDDCWSGMVNGIPADAGGFVAPIVTPGFTDPKATVLYKSLHQAASATDNKICAMKATAIDCNMPCGDPPNCTVGAGAYTFTADDLGRITTWMQQGAQNN